MADRLTTLEAKVAGIIEDLNTQTLNSRTVDQLTDANQPLASTDHVVVGQGTEARKAAFSDFTTGTGTKFIHFFTAVEGQTGFTVNSGVIIDDGQWFCQVGSELWNSTNGLAPFADGNISINFATGVITFQNGITLRQGTHVIFKHN